ncbi:hypothetical protein HWV62_30697 [Athelia sp. TMB]|nr:hypothetical protein HWV62_30697 [Athelia sp. TMB]
MIPLWGEEKKRKINLGGSRSASTHAAILDEAKARRAERESTRRRQEGAVGIQTWWKGIKERRRIRGEMRNAFERDVTGLNGLRCLALIGRDEEALGVWSTAMIAGGSETLFRFMGGPTEMSWLVLIKRISLLLVQSVADQPDSQYAPKHLQVLVQLFSSGHQGGTVLSTNLTAYLLKHRLYSHLARAIACIPIESKNRSKSLPLLVSLATLPLSPFPVQSPEYADVLSLLLSSILAIPLLPNRLPLASLTELSSRLPLASLNVISSHIPFIVTSVSQTPFSTVSDSKVDLIANLIAFVPPRYAKLPAPALATYLKLMTSLMNALPPSALDPPSKSKSGLMPTTSSSWAPDAETDSEDELPTHVDVVSSFSTPALVSIPPLDARTKKRLATIPDVKHLYGLLHAAQLKPSTQLDLACFFLALTSVWPSIREHVLTTLVTYTGGGLVREIWRGYVRGSPLGKEENQAIMMDTIYADAWPPLIFLAELYAQSLLTMGDDEFFASVSSSSVSSTMSGPRNPLTLDELVLFSRKLLNIAFTLYWREDQTNVQEGGVPGVNLKWEGVRESLTKCLQAIHARDFEEQQLAQPTGQRPLSKRQVAYLSPRLGVLNNIPFSIPFELRVSIFRSFVATDMMARGGVDRHSRGRSARTHVSVRRGNIAQDGFDKLDGANLKEPIEITFIDQFGQEEAGIDGGGVFKEFFTSLCKEVFDTDRGLWLANKKNELYPNPHSYATESHSLNWYRFIGRILGKAMYEGILVDVAFAGFFLSKWLGKQSFLDDLASLDPDLYQGLIFLKHYTGDPEDLSLNFTVAIEEFGTTKSIDLIQNGSNIPVTRENRLQYIQFVSHYRLSKQIKLQSEAFFEGLSEMIDTKWLRMFNQQEVQILLGGVNSPIDLEDLRTHTNYGGLYDNKETTIETFWDVGASVILPFASIA